MILFFATGFTSHKPDERQKASEPSAPSVELCKLENPPRTWDIHGALDNFTLSEDQASYEFFLEIDSSVRSFALAFLKRMPLDCDRSRALSALRALDEDSGANNRIDATLIYIKKVNMIFQEIHFLTKPDSQISIEAVWNKFNDLMDIHYPIEGQLSYSPNRPPV